MQLFAALVDTCYVLFIQRLSIHFLGYARLQLLLCECTKAPLRENGHYISLCKCTMNFCVSTGPLDVEACLHFDLFSVEKSFFPCPETNPGRRLRIGSL